MTEKVIAYFTYRRLLSCKEKTFREDVQGTFLVLYSLYKKITDTERNICKTTKYVNSC